jgi:membrane protein required for colicin V production
MPVKEIGALVFSKVLKDNEPLVEPPKDKDKNTFIKVGG